MTIRKIVIPAIAKTFLFAMPCYAGL
jgi:hypothetical protein